MSNPYGNDPQDHENGSEENAIHEHDAVREAPSDYEFADEHGGATADVDQNEESHALPAEEEKAGRRSPLLPIAAALGGVLVLAGVAWMQFGGGSASDAPQISKSIPSLSTSAAPPKPEPVAVVSPSEPVAPRTASIAQAPGMDSPPTSLVPPPLSAAVATPDAPIAPLTLPPAALAPSTTPEVVPPPVAVAVPVPPPAPLPTPVVAAASHGTGAPDGRIDALSERIDNLQRSLDQATQQLNQVSNMVAASATTSSTAAPSNKDMQDKIDHLEQQVASMHAPTSGAAPVPVFTTPDVSDAAPPATTAKVVKSHSAKHKPAVQKIAKAHIPTKIIHAKEAIEPTSKWVLRAATPGQAWVASDSSSPDLKQLQVGDNLAGIGRVTAIQQEDGNWVVQGTKGSIH